MNQGFVTAFAPASIGNVAVGFDMLGLAVQGIGDRVAARRRTEAGVVLKEVLGPDGEPHVELSTDPARNTASIAADALWRAAGAGGGLELKVCKGIPLQSGMGSSAASAVAAVVAANGLLDRPFELPALLEFALEGETFASGGLHADNVAPSLLGGLQLCPSKLLPQTVGITPPRDVSSVLLHPHLRVDTAASRRSLAGSYTLDQWLTQQGYLAAFLLGCERNDRLLISRSLRDETIEPQRAASQPSFGPVKAAAMASGALGCSLSGSGPAVFALCASKRAAEVRQAMETACRDSGTPCASWISPLDSPGARLE